MKAAVVTSFDRAPSYGDFREPELAEGEVTVTVTAAALTVLAKGRASGGHYSKEAHFPFVPGVDGVGRTSDGRRVYFAFPRAPFGAMAARTAVAAPYVVPIPDGIDDVAAASLANPGMSSWAALVDRARLARGESVWILGATGTSGKLAIQIAKHLGARHVVAVGRNPALLEALRPLGADALVCLEGEPAAWAATMKREIARSGADVVLDYLWGEPASSLLQAFAGRGDPEGAPRVRFVQIGSMAGSEIKLAAGALRSTGVELLGSGLGSVPWVRLIAAAAAVISAAKDARFAVDARAVPLADVARAWGEDARERIVFTP